MYYTITVVKNGHFFFSTGESLTYYKEAQEVYIALAERFPTTEGYEILVTKWEKRGTPLSKDELFSNNF